MKQQISEVGFALSLPALLHIAYPATQTKDDTYHSSSSVTKIMNDCFVGNEQQPPDCIIADTSALIAE